MKHACAVVCRPFFGNIRLMLELCCSDSQSQKLSSTDLVQNLCHTGRLQKDNMKLKGQSCNEHHALLTMHFSYLYSKQMQIGHLLHQSCCFFCAMAVNVVGGGHCTCKSPLFACTITQLRPCACLLLATQLARQGSQSLWDSTAARTHALQVSTSFLAAVMLRMQWFLGSTSTQCVLAWCSSVTGLKLDYAC